MQIHPTLQHDSMSHGRKKTFKSSFLGVKVSQNIDPSGNLITNTGLGQALCNRGCVKSTLLIKIPYQYKLVTKSEKLTKLLTNNEVTASCFKVVFYYGNVDKVSVSNTRLTSHSLNTLFNWWLVPLWIIVISCILYPISQMS